jgi:hypothetical protein
MTVKTFRFAWVLLACGILGGGLLAQQGTPPAAKSGDGKQMYEDIEVMRRILVQKLDITGPHSGRGTSSSAHTGLFAPTGSTSTLGSSSSGSSLGTSQFQGLNSAGIYSQAVLSPYTNPLSVSANYAPYVGSVPADIEGTYLKGYGVVFTVTAPAGEKVYVDPAKRSVGLASSCVKCHEAKDVKVPDPAPAPKPTNLWDKTREEVRGTTSASKPPTPAAVKWPVCQPGDLTDKILHMMAEYGHHFTELGDGEKLTVVVTFPPARPASHTARINDGAARVEAAKALGLVVDPVARDSELLGDLHVKQGKYKEAIEAYEKALKVAGEKATVQASPDTPYDDVVRQLEQARDANRKLRTKLAQAYLTTGDVDNARKVLEAANASLKVAPPKASAAAASEPAVVIPGKLIVTMPNRSSPVRIPEEGFAAWANMAKVETVGLTPPKK